MHGGEDMSEAGNKMVNIEITCNDVYTVILIIATVYICLLIP